jgi:oligopeptidase B
MAAVCHAALRPGRVCKTTRVPEPPLAPRRPTVVPRGRVDDWYWLRDRTDPETIAYLKLENAYTTATTEHTAPLRQAVYEEIVGRIEETDESAPVPWGGHWYYHRTVAGLQYLIHCRRTGALDAAEQVVLDENLLAEGHDYLSVGSMALSPDHRLLAYAVDVDGGEVHRVRVRDLESGEDLPDVIERTYYGLAWASDNRTLLYTRPDEAMRPWQLWRHHLGTPPEADVCVLTEPDDRFFLSVARSKTGRLIVIALGSQVTSEVHLLDAAAPEGEPRVVEPRRQGIEYSVADHGDRLFITTNDGAENFRLMEAPLAAPGRASWREVIGGRDDVKLDGVDVFARHLAVFERSSGLRRIRVMDLPGGSLHEVEQDEPVYGLWPGENPELDTDTLRFELSSPVTPRSTYDYDMRSRDRVLRKRVHVRGHDPSRYRTERLWAAAADGVRVPISVVHRADLPRDGSAPCLLYGYGSYEIPIDPVFSSPLISLLDRGFVSAIAHVRGGGEMGRRWYEDGKLLRKRTTFTDFCSCAEHLVAEGYTAHSRLAARGASAGGLLVGAAVTMRPELFGAVVAEVPFVDVVTTMLDDTLPLTVIEREEWGDPRQDEYYECMLSYSPYDNVRAREYPAMLVTGGLNDPRVGFWEPAKLVARMRALRTDPRPPLLLKMEMGAGHAGPSGRYERWRDEAFVYAFLIDTVAAAAAPGG